MHEKLVFCLVWLRHWDLGSLTGFEPVSSAVQSPNH